MIENIYPNDWTIVIMSKIFDFSGGYTATRNDLGDNGIAYLHYGDIHTSDTTILDVDKNIDKIPKIDLKKEDKYSKFLLKHSDVVFVDASEDYDGVSKFIVVNNVKNIPLISGLHTIVAKDKEKHLDINYKRYVFQEHQVRKQFMFYSAGQKVKGINKENVKKIIIPIPPLEEQKKIANILSTWDRAIDLKDKEIKNYEKIKENIAKKMIHSYEDKSANGNGKKMKNYLDIKTIRVGMRLIEPVAVGVFGIRKRSEIFDKDLSNDLSNNKVIERNDLCFGMGTNKIVYDVLLEDSIYCVSPAYKVYKVKGCNPYYLKTYLDTYNSYLSRKHMIISARQGKSIEFNGLMNELIYLPSIDIQNKVVDYLTKVDLKIKLLKTKHEYLKLQKKGLMQQLLTGKIRVQV